MRSPSLLLCSLSLSLIASVANGLEPQIRVVTDGDNRPVAIEAVGLPTKLLVQLAKPNPGEPDWLQLLAVFVLDNNGVIQPPALAGRYEVVADALRFTPQFTLRPGMNYQV